LSYVFDMSELNNDQCKESIELINIQR